MADDGSPFELPAFRARLPWLGGDLQTLRNTLRPPRPLVAGVDTRRIWFELPDGDRLTGVLHRPEMPTDAPLVMLVHGLTGCEDSSYMLATAAAFVAEGWPVLRLSLRGAGPTAPFCREFYHAGRTDDLRAIVAQLDDGLRAAGLVVMGYSLGANAVLKYLGEEGANPLLRAGVSVSAPIDLAETARWFARPRNHFYQRHLLSRMKDMALPRLTADGLTARDVLRGIRTVYQFDDRLVAPWNGFRDAPHYYAESMALRYLDGIRVPTLVVHAEDDPWIPPGSYRRYRWDANPHLRHVMLPGGGHVGFHVRGGGTWHDAAALRFLRAVGAAPGQDRRISLAASTAP